MSPRKKPRGKSRERWDRRALAKVFEQIFDESLERAATALANQIASKMGAWYERTFYTCGVKAEDALDEGVLTGLCVCDTQADAEEDCQRENGEHVFRVRVVVERVK